MNFNIKKLPRLFLGLFCYSLGIVLTLKANIGLAPWAVFHQGITNIIPLTFGQATSLVGTLIVLINFIFKEKIGIGTIFNMIMIGLFIDLISYTGIISEPSSTFLSIMMIICGMFIIAFATYLYVGAGLGSGPRDGLMLVLTKRTKYSVGIIRGSIELSVLLIGVILGGHIGFGTIILVLLIGPIVQITFKLLKFDIKEVQHQYLTR